VEQTDVLIIGAGPYGLSLAGHALARDLNYVVVGKPMGFWKHHMPRGMYLRSPRNWHLDSMGHLTLEHFLQTKNISLGRSEPIALNTFLDYAQWYQECNELKIEQNYVTRLEHRNSVFEAFFEDRKPLAARYVVVASGLQHFEFVPRDIVGRLNLDRYVHTSKITEPKTWIGKRCLIVGGRQSAFEWAALLREQANAEVHVVYRHETPRFEESDWSWVEPMIERMTGDPGWFRRQSRDCREAIHHRFWEEGRLKLEPWLASRIECGIHRWPRTKIQECQQCTSGVRVTLDTGRKLEVDVLIFGTGYRVDISKVPYLQTGSLFPKLLVVDGSPVLDESFQTNIPGLFFAGHPTIQDFGPFFGFVRGCGPTARIIMNRIHSAILARRTIRFV
jgi:cation diffusion facilitator CzcD-associated flavoprotein CzcO